MVDPTTFFREYVAKKKRIDFESAFNQKESEFRSVKKMIEEQRTSVFKMVDKNGAMISPYKKVLKGLLENTTREELKEFGLEFERGSLYFDFEE
jgi:hypothetical protein